MLAACGGQEAAEPAVEIAAPLQEATTSAALETAVPAPTNTAAPPPGTPTTAPTSAAVEEAEPEEPTQEEPTAEPEAEADPTATDEPAAEVVEPTPVQVISGQTTEGAYFYGSPDAPVTLFDYSDFL